MRSPFFNLLFIVFYVIVSNKFQSLSSAWELEDNILVFSVILKVYLLIEIYADLLQMLVHVHLTLFQNLQKIHILLYKMLH